MCIVNCIYLLRSIIRHRLVSVFVAKVLSYLIIQVRCLLFMSIDYLCTL